MSIFDIKPAQKSNLTTEGFYFGVSESEGENSYKQSEDNLFDDYLSIIPKINEGCFIITGRKGSGKSAIAKYIKDNSTFEESMFCDIIKSDAIKLEKQIQKTRTGSDEELISFFQWLILVKLVKLILESKDGNYTRELKAIHNFVKNNRGIVDIDKFAVSEVTTMTKQELNIGSLSNIPIFKAIIDRMIGKKMEKAPYYKLLPALKEIIYKVLNFPLFKDYKFVIIFDDLDIGFKAQNDCDKQTLMELLRAAKEFNNDLKETKNTKILVLLRDDIKKVLDGFDADIGNIFNTYVAELKWYDGKDNTLLRGFVNRRIAHNFKEKGLKYQANDPWVSLFNDDEGCFVDYHYNPRPAFKHILDHTFLRPRDLILFLKHIGTSKYRYPIIGQNIGVLLQKYAHANVTDLKAELAIHYSQEQIKEIFNTLRALSFYQNVGFDKMKIINELTERSLSPEVFNMLLDYYLILPIDSKTGKYYIGYRDADPSDYDVDSADIKYKLHKCIYAYFVPKSTLPNDAY